MYNCDLPTYDDDSDDDDNISCSSGPVSDSDDSWALLKDDCKPVDDDVAIDEFPTSASDSNSQIGRMDETANSKCKSNVLQEEEIGNIRWNTDDGITSMLEAKNNFVRRIQRYLMMPPDGEETGESENDTASTTYSKSRYPRRNKKGGMLFKSPSVFTSAPKSANFANQERKARGHKQVNETHGNLEFNECSTILAGDVDDHDGPLSDANCKVGDSDDEVQLAQSHDNLVELNKTVGGGLKLPARGAKQIVIGNVPTNPVPDVQSPFKSPSSKTKLNMPKTPQNSTASHSQRPFMSCPPKIKTRTPKISIKSTYQTSKSPCTPRSLLRLKPEEMLEVLRSPLPLEITPAKGRDQHQHVMPPKSLLTGLKKEDCLTRNTTPVQHGLRKASPLVRTLKKMQEEVEVKTNQRETPKRLTRLGEANETYIVSRTRKNVQNETSEKTLAPCRMQNSADVSTLGSHSTDISRSKSSNSSGLHDTYEFQSESNERESTTWKVADDLEKLFPVVEPASSRSPWNQKYMYHQNTSKWKDNKRKLSEADRDAEYPQGDPENVTQESAHTQEKESDLTRTPKRLKKQNKVLVTSTPIKKGSSDEEVKMLANSPKKSAYDNNLSLSRTHRHLKKQDKVLLTSTPVKKGNYSSEVETKLLGSSSEGTVNNNDTSNKTPQTRQDTRGLFTSTITDPSRQTMKNASCELNVSHERYRKKCVRKLSSKVESRTSKVDSNQTPGGLSTVLSDSPRVHRPRALTSRSSACERGTNSDLEEIDCDVQQNPPVKSCVKVHKHRKGILKNNHVGRGVTPKTEEVKRQKGKCDVKSSNGSGTTRTKCYKELSVKGGSPRPNAKSVSTSSDNNPAVNSSMSSSLVPCGGPGNCTKMFCFSCCGF